MTFTAFNAGPDYLTGQNIATGETSLPRMNCGTGAVLLNQQLQLTYWTAEKTEACTVIGFVTGSQAAAATPTYCAMGAYLANSDGSLTLLAQCNNDTTLFAGTFQTYSRPLTSIFYKTAGIRYALGVLVVSAVALPNLVGYSGTAQQSATNPRTAAIVTGQSVLPASVPSGSIANSPGNAYFGLALTQ